MHGQATGRLLLRHLKVQWLAAVGALGLTFQQLLFLKHGSGAAVRAGHLVLHGSILVGLFLVAFQRHLKVTPQWAQLASPASRSSSLTYTVSPQLGQATS